MLKYTMHLHDRQNKVVLLMKRFIFVYLSNDVKFHNYTMKSCKFLGLKHT
jgi:hypothetical protein